MPPKRNKRDPNQHLKHLLNSSTKSQEQLVSAARILYNAEVINNIDPLKSNRIQVRLSTVDVGTPDAQLSWCIPALPTHLFILPKIGEHVLILVSNPWNPTSGRYYLGPVMSNGNVEEPFRESILGFGLVDPDE